MDGTTIIWIAGLMAVAAALYSSVGHGGASAYLAIMALFSVAPETMRPTALALNLVVATFAAARFALKGQWVDVTDVPAGKYRLFTDIDPKGWFHEASTKNNRTWIDIDLRRTPQGLAAPKIGTGPSPS